MSNHSDLRETILRELDEVVCTKHPPDWDIETRADNIIAAVEEFCARQDRDRAKLIDEKLGLI